MTASADAIEQLARDVARHTNPDDALRALTALRGELDALEPVLVARYLRAGASWSRVAEALGVSKQAAHRKHRDVLAEAEAMPPPAGEPKILVTAEARRCVQLARQEAHALGHDAVGTEHLLLGVLRCKRSHAVTALNALGVTLELAREGLQPTMVDVQPASPEEVSSGAFGRRRDITAGARRILEGALREAVALRDGYIGVEHLLLALLSDRSNGAVRTLQQLDVTPARIRRQLEQEWSSVAAATERIR